jgi:hypothetical protein
LRVWYGLALFCILIKKFENQGRLHMSDQSLEERCIKLEQQLVAFQARYIAHVRYDHMRLMELEMTIRGLENRIQDLAYIERAVLAVHDVTHARDPETPDAFDPALDEAIHRISLSSRSSPPHQDRPS